MAPPWLMPRLRARHELDSETILEHMLHDHGLFRDMHWNTFGHLSLTTNGLTTQQQMHMHNQEDEWLHRSRAY